MLKNYFLKSSFIWIHLSRISGNSWVEQVIFLRIEPFKYGVGGTWAFMGLCFFWQRLSSSSSTGVSKCSPWGALQGGVRAPEGVISTQVRLQVPDQLQPRCPSERPRLEKRADAARGSIFWSEGRTGGAGARQASPRAPWPQGGYRGPCACRRAAPPARSSLARRTPRFCPHPCRPSCCAHWSAG